MSFINRIKNSFTKDYNKNDRMANFYGYDLKIDTYEEIEKTTRKNFRETEDLNNKLLEIYKDKEHVDMQQEIMKKYLGKSQDEINQQMFAQDQQVNEEIDKVAQEQGLSEEEKEKIKQQALEDSMSEQAPEGKDKKEAIKALIYSATYKVMYEDYAKKALKMKHEQYNDRDLAMGKEETMEIIAMEKNLEKLDLLYFNHTGKNITDIEKIQQRKEEFQKDFNDEEKSIQDVATKNTRSLDTLYKIRAEKHEKYIKALKNPALSDYEKATYKREYEEANLDFIQNNPSLEEYKSDLRLEEKNKEEIEKADLKEPSAAQKYMYKDEKELDGNPDAKKVVDRVQEEKLQRDEKSFEMSQVEQKDAIDKGDIRAAKNISDVQREGNIYEENIDKVPGQSSRSEIKQEQEKEQEISDRGFFNSLKKVRNPEERTTEELEDIASDNEKISKDQVQEKSYEEMQKQEEYQREIRRKNDKPNHN